MATLSCSSAKDGPAATHAEAGTSVTGPTCPSAAASVHAGDGTYYTFADGSGNCMFPATPNRNSVHGRHLLVLSPDAS